MTSPLVSVLMPCYNAQNYIGEALASVFGQTWPNVEVVIVDDGSTDNSINIARKIAGERCTLIEQPNRGAAHARNKALKHAAGSWCLFLDADDWLDPNFILDQLEAITVADADICFGNSVLVWPHGRRVEKVSMPADSSIDFALSGVLADGWYPLHALLWRTSFAHQIGGWDTSLRRNQDGEFIARALLQRPRITASAGSRAIYRQHSGTRISSRIDHLSVESNVRIIERLCLAITPVQDMPLARRSLSRQAFELASEAYHLGYRDLGFRAEAIWQTLGPPYQRTGSLLHRIGTRLMGLEGKVVLAKRLHTFKRSASAPLARRDPRR